MTSQPHPPARFDPYKNFKFRFSWDGREVAAASKVSALREATAPGAPAAGAVEPRLKGPGRDQYESITVERGVTRDAGFQSWALGSGTGPRKRDVTVELHGDAGQPVRRYKLRAAWASEFQAQPAGGDGAGWAFEHLRLEHEGLEAERAPSPA